MEEIQEREHIYIDFGGNPHRWRSGQLEEVDVAAGGWAWLPSPQDEKFLGGEPTIIDPLTGEFVCPPKSERPYDMTAGQVFDALEEDEEASFENRLGDKAICVNCQQKVRATKGGILPFGGYAHHDLKWRKVED